MAEHRSFIQELADTFTRIGRLLGDPEVQDAGDKFFGALQRAADRELPGGPRLMTLAPTREDKPDGGRDNDGGNDLRG